MSAGDRDHTPRWYGRRRGKKLRPGRRSLLDSLLPHLRLHVPGDGAPPDPAAAFQGPVDAVWLEIGFGAGEHLAAQAGAHPGLGFIGCEPFVNGVASLLSRIETEGLTNVRIFDDDARRLLPVLPDACVERVFTLFSDPWPKTRHHKRRFIGPGTVAELARILIDGGELRFASDHGGYVAWALEHITRHGDFSWIAESKRDWTEPPSDWIATRYEKKALTQGVAPVYLRFRRRRRAAPGQETGHETGDETGHDAGAENH